MKNQCKKYIAVIFFVYLHLVFIQIDNVWTQSNHWKKKTIYFMLPIQRKKKTNKVQIERCNSKKKKKTNTFFHFVAVMIFQAAYPRAYLCLWDWTCLSKMTSFVMLMKLWMRNESACLYINQVQTNANLKVSIISWGAIYK